MAPKDTRYDKVHFDHTKRMLENEQKELVRQTIHKEFHRVTEIGNTNSADVAINSLILRNYNDGAHGGWNNYAPFKGVQKGTYVKAFQPEESKQQ